MGMHKTTVYLPQQVRVELKRMAGERGTSEAYLIREALERLVAAEGAPTPRLPLGASELPPCAEDVDAALAAGFGRP
jgi:hypothetical protein